MSPENVSPSLAGHRTPLTPCNNPTILDDQIPYLSLCQTDSPLFHYSTNTSSEALPPSSSNASSAIYPYLYSTPPTAGPETPLNGVSVFTAAQESQTIFVGHEGNTGTFCEAHAPQMSTLAPSPYSEPNPLTVIAFARSQF